MKSIDQIIKKREDRARYYWVPACGGTEIPFKAKNGYRIQYLWNPVTHEHKYYNLDTDLFVEDSDLFYYLP